MVFLLMALTPVFLTVFGIDQILNSRHNMTADLDFLAQEIHAQIEQIKGTVKRSTSLINGRTGLSRTQAQHCSLAQSSGNRPGSQPALKTQKIIASKPSPKTSQVIPLEEGNFKDF